MAVWGRMCDLSMACLWPGISLDLNGFGARSETLLCPSYGMFVGACDGCMCGLLLWASLMPQLVLRTKLSLFAFD